MKKISKKKFCCWIRCAVVFFSLSNKQSTVVLLNLLNVLYNGQTIESWTDHVQYHVQHYCLRASKQGWKRNDDDWVESLNGNQGSEGQMTFYIAKNYFMLYDSDGMVFLTYACFAQTTDDEKFYGSLLLHFFYTPTTFPHHKLYDDFVTSFPLKSATRIWPILST